MYDFSNEKMIERSNERLREFVELVPPMVLDFFSAHRGLQEVNSSQIEKLIAFEVLELAAADSVYERLRELGDLFYLEAQQGIIALGEGREPPSTVFVSTLVAYSGESVGSMMPQLSWQETVDTTFAIATGVAKEIHRANMAKRWNNVTKDLEKPEGWEPPDIEKVVKVAIGKGAEA